MTTQNPFFPLTHEQLSRLQSAISDLTPQHYMWLSGYFWGIAQGSTVQDAASILSSSSELSSTDAQIPTPRITLLSASQTGNARRVATQLAQILQEQGHHIDLVSAAEINMRQLDQIRQLLIVISTQGDGDPPEEASALFSFLQSRKAPSLQNTEFAIFALGDSSYPQFCQAGKFLDERLEALNAQRLLPRVDADTEYQPLAEQWFHSISDVLKKNTPATRDRAITPSLSSVKSAALTHSKTEHYYQRDTPFNATLSVNQKITSRDSDKDVRHIEIDLENSGIQYQPGDALGVWYENHPALVDEFLALFWLEGSEVVTLAGNTHSLRIALQQKCELTQNNSALIKRYAPLARHPELLLLAEDQLRLQEYASKVPLVEMFRTYPARLEAQQWVDLLRPLTPRLYSIASAQEEVGNEVHISVGVVRYHYNQQQRTGGASGYLADQLVPEQKLRIFIEPNDRFRLPEDPATPIVMIGPGTGIAPFRAFLQHRSAQGSSGKNWLFFGNPHFTSDFLYQTEWQRYFKEGVLTRMDLAWSRDQEHKVYVQDKIREQGAELWRWIENGAHLYVCGDATHMAKDVEQALLNVIVQQSNKNHEDALEFLNELRMSQRYQRDVY